MFLKYSDKDFLKRHKECCRTKQGSPRCLHMCDIYIFFCNSFDLVLFLKLGETSVMVTAVSKTKPSPAQFMPLLVGSLTLRRNSQPAFVIRLWLSRDHPEELFSSIVTCICNVNTFGRGVFGLSNERTARALDRWTTDRKRLPQVESPLIIWGESWAPVTTRSSPADS